MTYATRPFHAPGRRAYTGASPKPGATVSHDARIETLEFKVAHLERGLQELSDLIYRQQQQLDAQASRLRQLAERREASDTADAAPSFEVPPHY